MERLFEKGVLLICTLLFQCSPSQNTDVSVISSIPVAVSNSNYIGNRAPLGSTAFIKLPVTAIKPQGWLREYLNRQRDGLTGNLGNISAWLTKKNNAWLSRDGKGEFGWEEVPYWLKGYANLGYLLNDEKIINESKIWIEGVLNSQRADGNFGPTTINKEGAEDFWPKMIMMYCLQSYYEFSGDQRVISFMKNFFAYQLNYPEEKFIKQFHYWQGLRTGDNLHSVLWLYNLTGEKWLLDLARKIHRNSTSWANRNNKMVTGNEGADKFDWFKQLPDWHNVNVAQGFREPATFFQVSKDSADLKASYGTFNIIRKYFGQVPGGMFGSDEIARAGYTDPRQGVETCGMVEQMNSDEHLFRITGDIFWADHAEEVAFNTYPAATMPDFRSLRYITSPNMVLNDDQNHFPGIANSGPFLMMNPFSSRCCQHNHAQGWPYFTENLWMATSDNGLCAAIYSASEVKAKVGSGQEVSIKEISNYPFEENIIFLIALKQDEIFPVYLRIPHWCTRASIKVNGKDLITDISASKFVCLKREWHDNDKIELSLPMSIKIKTWTANHHSVSLSYGPLTFSLLIGENYKRKESDLTAIGDSRWQKTADTKNWPSFEIQPTTPWNYGLVINADSVQNFKLERRPWPTSNFPFTTEEVPIAIKAKGKIIPNWKIDQHGLAGVLKDSPVISTEPEKEIILIPMGAARLRISAFPQIGNGPTAKQWQ